MRAQHLKFQSVPLADGGLRLVPRRKPGICSRVKRRLRAVRWSVLLVCLASAAVVVIGVWQFFELAEWLLS